MSNVLSERLQKARKHAGMTQKQLAETFDKKYPGEINTRNDGRTIYNSLKKWEIGKGSPSFDKIVKIADILDCDLSYLSGENPENVYRLSTYKAHEEIGLNYETVERMKNYDPEIKHLLEKLTDHSNADNLLELLNAIYSYSLYAHHTNVRLETIGERISDFEPEQNLLQYDEKDPLPSVSKRMLKFQATSILDHVLSDTYDDYTEKANELLKTRIDEEADFEKKQWLNVYESSKWNKLTIEETKILGVGTIGNNIPTKEEAFKKIEKRAERKYQLYKENPPAE